MPRTSMHTLSPTPLRTMQANDWLKSTPTEVAASKSLLEKFLQCIGAKVTTEN